MNILVILPLILSIVQANAADKQDVKTKTTSSPVNAIQQSPKYEMIYQPLKFQQPLQQVHQQIQLQPVHHVAALQPFQHLQQRPQYIPIQIIPKQYYMPQPTPQAMIIIAQPALLPQSLVYGNPAQQLLNYFHNNPQAKYQFLHGNYQPQTHQPQQIHHTHQAQAQAVPPTTTYMHPVLAAPSLGNYIFTPSPQVTTQLSAQARLIAQPSPVPVPAAPVQYTTQQSEAPIQHAQQPAQQPAQLGSLAQLAQLAAQQYVSTQMKTAPAIVTGFEQFSPEQQAQIKAQLSSHLGTNYHAVTGSGANQYSSKYVADQEKNNNFVPSPQVKSEPVTTVSSQAARYMQKGKM